MTSHDPSRRQDVVGLVDFASRVLRTGDRLVGAGVVIAKADPGEAAFGADGPGGLGELCRRLHRQWTAALAARAREAKRQGERLGTVAERLGRVAADYTGADVTLATDLSRPDRRSESPLLDAARPDARSVTVRPGQEV